MDGTGVIAAATDAGAGTTSGTGLGRYACSQRNGCRLSTELEITRGKFLECALIFKIDHLTESLTAQLETERNLGH